MHGPHKSRGLLVAGPDDATVRPFLVPLRCYYCAALIGQKSTLMRRDIYTLFHLGQSWMKQVGENPRIATHKLCALPSTIFPPLADTFMQTSLFLLLLFFFLFIHRELLPSMFEKILSPITSGLFFRSNLT